MAIIILYLIPVFALIGQEGKIFPPLAFTQTFAMAGATLLAVTLVPVLCTFLIGGKVHSEGHNPVMRFLRRLYEPALTFALKHRVIAVCGALILFLGAILFATNIGSEFMPPLNERDLL